MSEKTAHGVALSVIVVSYNTVGLLRNCLRSVQQEAKTVPLEAIVVDNASHDGSAEMIVQEFPEIMLIKNERNIGFAAANNQGLRSARGEALLLLNSDTEVRSGAFAQCLKFLDNNSPVGIVGCKLVNPDGSLQPSCESFLSLSSLFFENFFIERLFSKSAVFGQRALGGFAYHQARQVDYVKGAFLLIKRRALEDIGFLDENFFFYAEEMDWCYRARQKGWQTYFTPEAIVLHHGGQSSDPISPKMFVQLHRARYQFYRKHHNAFLSLLARLIMTGGALLRIAIWAFITAFRFLFMRTHREEAQKKLAAVSAAFVWFLKFERN